MALKSETLHKAPNEGINNDAITSGEDLEDGEIFDDEAEAEETSETEVPKNSKVEIQKRLSVSPSSNNAVSVSKSVLKNDAHNGADRTEKKSENKFANQQRWMDETTKKEEKNRREHFDAEKRFKEKKLKRKKPKDEDSENDGPANFKGKKRKTSFERELEKLEDSDYIDEEDEEMLNIRGASPSRWLDIFSDEEDDSFDGSEGGGRGGGREHLRGGAARRRGSGFRGGRIDRNSRRERIERMSSRGKRRGKGVGMRGGKKRAEDKEICIYHMQGKCHRGNDCPFSHDAMPPRKMELCKFYLMDCCAKKDKCLYMHSEFPCKYFHTGLKCFAGKNCKFSHAKLTDDLRAILNKTYNGLSGMNEFTSKHQEPTGKHRQHLETAPKEILGDFPRLREATRNLKKSKKIPSLFDLKISPPRDMQSDSDGNHTPMPSPTHQPNNKDFFRESMEREHTPPQIGERRRGEHHHHKSSEHHRSSKSGGSHASMQQQQQQRKESRRSDRGFEGEGSRSSRDRRDSKSAGGGSGRRSSREDSAAAGEHPHHHHHHHHNHHHHENSSRSSANNSGSGASSHAANNSRRQSYSPPNHRYEEDDEQEEPVNERLKAPEPDQSSNDLLSHLPKKQRELFLRIQQQQREAENSQESNPEDDDQDNDYNKQEENWYSSEDEESTPLTTILKSINIQKTSMTNSSHSPNQQRSHHHHHHNHHNHHNDQQSHTQVSDEHLLHESSSSSSSSALPVTIPDIDFGDVSALLSKVKQHIQTTADKLKVRDPRLRPDLEPSEKHHQHSTSISDSPHTHTDPPTHARTTHAHAPAQLSPSISAILNSAAAARGHHHPAPRSSPSHSHSPHHNSSSSSSFPPSHSSSYSSSSHHHSSSFPPPTPSMNDDDDGDDDDDDDNGISSPDDPFASEDQMSGLKGLPFKPAPVHTAATEIDASINSHPPIVYRLRPIQASKPDYSAIQNMPTGGALDPRWRKAVRFSEESGLGAASRRDPRHRLADDTPRAPAAAAAASSHPPAPAADPRQRLAAAMMNSTAHSMLAPPTPRYDDDPAPSSNMAGRGGAATPQMDAGMYCPPTPRLDDEPQPQPSPVMASSLRRTDPRQRQHLLNQPNQQQGMTSFYDQIRQQQQMQFMPNQQQMMFDPSRPMYGSDMPANINRQPQYNNYK